MFIYLELTDCIFYRKLGLLNTCQCKNLTDPEMVYSFILYFLEVK